MEKLIETIAGTIWNFIVSVFSAYTPLGYMLEAWQEGTLLSKIVTYGSCLAALWGIIVVWGSVAATRRARKAQRLPPE